MALSGATITKVPWTGIGTDPNTATTAGGAIPSSSNTLLEGAVSDVLGLKGTAVTDTAAATAATTQATGYDAEGKAYDTSQEIANQNAVVAGVAGGIKTLQEQRSLDALVGTQQSQVAAAGFGAAGSSLDILRSSLQQGYLTQQLTATQTALTKGGYLQEAAASAAQSKATAVTAAAARDTAAAYTAAAATSTANAAKETAALNDFTSTATLTADQKLILSPLTGSTTTSSTAATGIDYTNAGGGIDYTRFGGTKASSVITYGNKI